MKTIISTDKAPAAIGPYSQAMEVNGMVYTSGVIPVVPSTGEIPEGSQAQAKQALENLSDLLQAAGTDMDHVIKTTVFIKEMNDFGAINEVYATYFTLIVTLSLLSMFPNMNDSLDPLVIIQDAYPIVINNTKTVINININLFLFIYITYSYVNFKCTFRNIIIKVCHIKHDFKWNFIICFIRNC